ncbi:hypothetical protein AAHB62_30025 [Bacillus cereus]
MTVIGDILRNPEVGWNRINCKESNENYFEFNQFNTSSSDTYYFGSVKDSYLRFKFLGKQLRVIAELWKGPGIVSISIDGGAKEYFNLYKDLGGGLQGYTFLLKNYH